MLGPTILASAMPVYRHKERDRLFDTFPVETELAFNGCGVSRRRLKNHLVDRNQVVSRDEWQPEWHCSKMRTAFSQARCTEPGTARTDLGYSAFLANTSIFSPWRNKSSHKGSSPKNLRAQGLPN
jgi:hypothetical protein